MKGKAKDGWSSQSRNGHNRRREESNFACI